MPTKKATKRPRRTQQQHLERLVAGYEPLTPSPAIDGPEAVRRGVRIWVHSSKRPWMERARAELEGSARGKPREAADLLGDLLRAGMPKHKAMQVQEKFSRDMVNSTPNAYRTNLVVYDATIAAAKRREPRQKGGRQRAQQKPAQTRARNERMKADYIVARAHDRMKMPEATKYLAKKYGLTLPQVCRAIKPRALERNLRGS